MALKGKVRDRSLGKATLDPDFFIEVYQPKIEHNGEDSYYYGVGNTVSVVGSFDGSGGSGSQRYENFQNKTGAYVGSRALSGAVRDWYVAGEAALAQDEAAGRLKERVTEYLSFCKKFCKSSSRMRGSMIKEFPTTCALIAYRKTETGREALSLWAGDSRCYLLDARGLHQLSIDDNNVPDAMDNLTENGVMTNLVSASKEFALHAHAVPVEGPCVIFTATDGCFDYVRTPMEFEYLLLWTLAEAGSPVDWEDRMRQEMGGVTGDDMALCGLSVGYGSFVGLKKALRPRLQELYEQYVRDAGEMDMAGRRALWDQYKGEYYALASREA